VNARSIVNKIEALNELIIDVQSDILPFTETWLTPTNGDSNLASCCPPFFSAVHQPRASRKGGRVAIIFKLTISVRRYSHSTFNSFNRPAQQGTLIDCSLSCRPSVNLLSIDHQAHLSPFFATNLNLSLNKLPLATRSFSLSAISTWASETNPTKWQNNYSTERQQAFGLSQLVTSATHNGGSILDLVFARSSDDLVCSTSVLGYFSDHQPVLVSLSSCAHVFHL
jgi:hypothetical protein